MSTVYDEKLLDKVGMAMVPSGYTNNAADEGNAGGALGKVYSVLPVQTTSDSLTADEDVYQGSESNGIITSTATNGDCRKRFSVTNNYSSYIISGKFKSISSGSQIGVGYNYNTSFSFSYEELERVSVGETFSIKVPSDSQTYANVVFKTVDGLNSGGTFELENISIKGITNGDFDFSRGSDATRVNSQGYIESVQVLSDELVQNGRFDDIGSELSYNPTCDDSIPYGATGSGYSDEDGTDQVYFYNGGIKTERLRTGNLRLRLAKSNGVSSGLIESNKIYKVTFDVIEANFNGSGSANIQFYFDGTGDFASISETPASYEFYVKSSNVGNGIAQWSLSDQNIGYYVVYDNVSVKEVGQNWTFGNNATIKEENDNLKFSLPTSTSGTLLYQDGTTSSSVGFKGRITFTISNYQQGSVNPRLHNDGGDSFSSNGTFSSDVIKTSTFNRVQFLFTNFIGDIDNISVVEVTDDTDIPRLDYTNAACPSLLLEPERRNDIINSEDFTSYLSNASQQADSSASPSNQINAANIYPSSNGIARGVSTSITGTSGVDYTISVFVKSNGKNFVYCTNVNNSSYDVWFDLSNGTISGTGSNNATITNYTNDWYRIAYTSTSTSTTIWSRFLLSDSDGSTSVTVDGTNGVLFYGLQVEQGSYPTSYIPTNGELVTRRADVCDNAGDSTIFNDDEGVLFMEMQAIANDGTDRFISISDGTNDNILRLQYTTTDNQVNAQYKTGGTTQASLTANLNALNFNKIAVKYKQNDFALWVNGVEVAVDNSGNVNSLGTFTQFNFARGQAAFPFYGNTRQVLYFNEALSDAELEYITSADIDLTIHNYKGSLSKISATYEDVGVKDRLTKLF